MVTTALHSWTAVLKRPKLRLHDGRLQEPEYPEPQHGGCWESGSASEHQSKDPKTLVALGSHELMRDFQPLTFSSMMQILSSGVHPCASLV